MARSNIDIAADLLYPDTGRRTVDVKFSVEPARGRNISAEALAGMVVSSLEAVAAGRARPVADLTGY